MSIAVIDVVETCGLLAFGVWLMRRDRLALSQKGRALAVTAVVLVAVVFAHSAFVLADIEAPALLERLRGVSVIGVFFWLLGVIVWPTLFGEQVRRPLGFRSRRTGT